MTGTGRRAALVGAVLAAGALAGGCGLPAPGHPQRIEPSTVPFGLLATAAPDTAAPHPVGPATTIFLVRGERLQTATRRVLAANIPAQAVRALLDGPTPAEAARGITSDIPAQTRLVSLDVATSVATVDLNAAFATVSGSEEVLAVAQIVYTLTASPSIDAVQFKIDGKRIEVPDQSGSLSLRPRGRSDYLSLRPR